MAEQDGSPIQPQKIIERSFVWFILGVVVAAVLGTVGALTWLEDFVDRRVKETVGEIGSLPSSAIMVFDRADGCPSGWTRFVEGEGRFIAGASFNGGYSFRATGGVTEIDLNVNHLPGHRHWLIVPKDTGVTLQEVGVSEGNMTINQIVIGSDLGVDIFARDDGDHSHPIETIPPYIALYFCKKEAG